jgi:hypothetical protein
MLVLALKYSFNQSEAKYFGTLYIFSSGKSCAKCQSFKNKNIELMLEIYYLNDNATAVMS